jgi:hypothetical protein
MYIINKYTPIGKVEKAAPSWDSYCCRRVNASHELDLELRVHFFLLKGWR